MRVIRGMFNFLLNYHVSPDCIPSSETGPIVGYIVHMLAFTQISQIRMGLCVLKCCCSLCYSQ